MELGRVVGGRFELLRLAGSGGMGAVFEALDRDTGERVAVKVLHRGAPTGDARLMREARVLASVSHAAIVRHVAHGATPDHEPYLVMEWLDGEDLASLLARRRLSASEVVTLGRRMAEGLGALHAQGVVHRDVKPSNVFLVGGALEEAKLLDFGLVRPHDETQLTQSGAMVGTIGFMAPEQARAGEALDARADVFSLGVVLWKALTGTAPFEADKVMAVLAKILLEQPPPASDLCAGVPPALDALIARMLAKDPDDRPSDGHDVAAALAAIGDADAGEAPEPAPALTTAERRLLSVVLVEAAPRARPDDAWSAMVEIADAFGGRLERLADGTVAMILSGSWVATDQAAQAARCALAIRARVPERRIALSTARSDLGDRAQASDVIDRTTRLLDARRGGEGTTATIAVDDLVAGLLDSRFTLDSRAGALALIEERPDQERTLLGRPTAFVGRDRELSLLQELFDDCADEPRARAALVTAPPGVGKSRLARELARVVAARKASIWLGSGDPLRSGSAFGMLRAALRGVFGIHDGEPLPARRRKVLARVAQRTPAARARYVAELLGEIVAVPFPDDESQVLRAARRDPQLMGEHLSRAWEDFLAAECAAQPVLLVLDDLQWGDLPSVRFVDGALRRLADRPLMVVALGRPEVDARFPGLWEGRRPQRIALEELGRRASERLVRDALGAEVDEETVRRVVALSGGHAFYLEELIRAVATGRDASLPETVLAMVEARLGALDPGERRILRAASVFGDVVWSGGVAALLGGELSPPEARRALAALAERELFVERRDGRFPGELELSFRHALLREGAYAMLTDEDRALGHRLAARWLEEHGEPDSRALAEHLERGGENARAAGYHLAAAQQMTSGGDVDEAIACARRGLAHAVAPEVRVGLLALLCAVHGLRREWAASAAFGEEVLGVAAPGSAPWMMAAAARLVVSTDPDRVERFMEAMTAVEIGASGTVAQIAFEVANGCFFLGWGGRMDLAETIYQRFRAIAAPVLDREPVVRGWLLGAESLRALWGVTDPWTALSVAREGRAAFETVEHRLGMALFKWLVGASRWMLGASAQAARDLGEIQDADMGMLSAFSVMGHVFALAESGADATAEARARALIEAATTPDLIVDAARGHAALAAVLQRRGDLAGAERELGEALGVLPPMEQMAARAMLSTVLLAQRRAADALAAAEQAMAAYRASGAFGYRGVLARLALAEALCAHDRRNEARAVVVEACEHVRATAAAIADPELRRSYLESVPENARALALERALTGA